MLRTYVNISGKGNGLLGRYFHDSGMAITLTDALFDLNYVALTLGSTVVSGGISLYESRGSGETVATGGVVTLTHAPVAFEGSVVAWYKKPDEDNWNIATNIVGNTMTIPAAQAGDHYCVKYFYQNDSAKSVAIKVDRVPSVLHLVILNDLFSGNPADGASTDRWGRLITDIPAFQMDGNQDLSLTSSSAATVSLTGSALAVGGEGGCEDDLIYGTMTQEQYGADWRSEAKMLAVLNSDVELTTSETEMPVVYAVFGGNVASARKANSYFTFTKTGTGFNVNADTGEITATGEGSGLIEVAIKGEGYSAEPAFIRVTVTQ